MKILNTIKRPINYCIRKFRERKQEIIFKNNNYEELISSAIEDIKTNYDTNTIYVLGNGPSLNKQNLNLLENRLTIASNAFYLIYERINWRPTIFTIEDPIIVDDNINFFNSDCESWKFIPYDLSNKIINRDKCIYLNFKRSYVHWRNSSWPFFSNNVSKISYWGGTVSYLSLQIAASINPKRIVLLGTDLSYTIPKSVKKSGINLLSTEDDVNHFSPDYFGKGKKWHIPEVHRMQRSFDAAHESLKNINIELLNATDGGNLKNIPRIDFEEICK